MDRLGYLLALLGIPHISSGILFKTLKQYPDLISFFKESALCLKHLGFTDEQIKHIHYPPWLEVEQALRWGQQPNHSIITYEDDLYPKLLKEISAPPYVLYLKGQSVALNNLQIAMVGSRNPTYLGKELAVQFAYELAQMGITITSGLAIGIDGASHNGALQAQGQTIAVLGTGLNQIYPKRHKALVDCIAEKGSVISEFPLNTPPYRQNFPRRNRIISGLAKGVLVIEAALRSGSLITARYALEQGREVFALPHSIHSPLGKGCHHLLRQGAKMVESVTDILEDIVPQLEVPIKRPHLKKQYKKLASDAKKLLQCLEYEPVAIEILTNRCNFKSDKLLSLLLELELADIIVKVPGGYQRIT